MPDILSFIPQPTTVVINGKSYGVMPFTVNEMSKLQKWINSVATSPYVYIKLNELNSDARQDVLREMKKWHPPTIGSEDANEYLNSLEGLQAMLTIILKRADPSVTDADIQNIQGSYTLNGFTELMTQLTEISFGKNDENPKAE